MTTWTILTTAALVLSLTACGHTRIEEDDPGWDCHTMGNHVCGPATTGDVIVGHSRHDLYDSMVTRQHLTVLDPVNVVPDSRQGCWVEDNGYGPERICGLLADSPAESA
jgi:hypothetical protein